MAEFAIDATAISSIIALIVSLGGAGVLAMRGKAVTAVTRIVKILNGVSELLVAITSAQADDKVTDEELATIKQKATLLQAEIRGLKVDLGL
jgi:hypothetical protein